MNWLRKTIRNWLSYSAPDPIKGAPALEETPENVLSRLVIVRAVNGYVLQIGKYKPNPHGPDWTFASYVVPEGEDITDAIKACITIGALSK